MLENSSNVKHLLLCMIVNCCVSGSGQQQPAAVKAFDPVV
jgi:hypothetical protein